MTQMHEQDGEGEVEQEEEGEGGGWKQESRVKGCRDGGGKAAAL